MVISYGREDFFIAYLLSKSVGCGLFVVDTNLYNRWQYSIVIYVNLMIMMIVVSREVSKAQLRVSMKWPFSFLLPIPSTSTSQLHYAYMSFWGK